MTRQKIGLGLLALVCLIIPVRAQESEYLPVSENLIVHVTPTEDSIDGKPCVVASSDVFFVAWHAASGRVAFTRVSREGEVLDPGGVDLGTGTSYPEAVWNGSHFFCTWVNNGAILGARVNPDGTVVDTTPLSLIPKADSYPRPCPIVFNGTDYLIVWRTNSQTVRAARLSLEGVLLDPDTGFYVGDGFYPRVAWNGSGYLVVWYCWNPSNQQTDLDIFAARISAEGSVVAPGAFVLSSRTVWESHPSVASDGTNFLVVWKTSPATTSDPGDLYGVRVSGAGVVLDSEPLIVDHRAAFSAPIIYDGENYLIAFERENGMKNFRGTDVHARRMRSDGILVDNVPFPLCTAYWNQWGPYVGYADGVFLCTWNDNRTGRVESGHGLISGQVMQRQSLAAASVAKSAGKPAAPVGAGSPSWVGVTSPVSSDIYNITGLDQDSFYAVGYLDREPGGYVLRLENGQWNYWTEFKRMYGLWAGSPENIWTVGMCWAVASYRGDPWNPGNCQGTGEPIDPNSFGFGVWGTANNSVMTVGTEGRFQLFDGPWVMGSTGVTYDLVDAWGTAQDNIYAVGEAGTVMHYDGLAWSKVAAIPTRQSLSAIWGSGPNDIFVVGDYGTIVHYDGSQWEKLESGTTSQLRDVSGFNGSDVYAVGIDGTLLHYDGIAWQAETSGIEADLFGVSAAGHTVWAVGQSGVILKKEFDSVTVTSPNGGESWMATTIHDITWSSTGSIANVDIDYSSDSGSSWNTIVSGTANTGSYSWSVPDAPSATCLVRVVDAADPGRLDMSNAVFTIAAFVPPAVTVTSPDGGESWLAGSSHAITWSSTGAVGDVRIRYSIDSGNTWIGVATATANDGSYAWTIPDTPSTTCLVEIGEASDGSPYDNSNALFTIVAGTYTVSGKVTSGGGGLANVSLSGLPGNPLTDMAGNYSAEVAFGWDGTVTPTLSWYTFAPANRIYANVTADQTAQNYTATAQSGIALTSPNGGEYWGKGTTQTITWSSGGNIGAKVKIMLYKGTVLSKTLSLGAPTANGSFSWKIPATMALGNTYKIKITSATNAAYTDMSDASFNIVAESITVAAPNGGEKLIAGTTQTISWTYKGSLGATVKLELYKGGNYDDLITLSAPVGSLGKGSFGWTIPSDLPSGQDYSVKVSSTTNGLIFDTSNAGFMVYSGLATAWGSNAAGELGDGTTFNSSVPVLVNALSAVRTLAAGRNFSAALRSDGTVRTWGSNDKGQLGNGTFIGSLTPVQVSGLSGITVIAAGGSFALGLKSTGLVQAWGENGEGQLGNAKTIDSNVPVLVSGLTKYKAIAAGSIHAAAVASDGTIRTWGSNYYGQLGLGTYGNVSSKPVKVLNLTGGLAVAAGAGFTAVLKKDGTVWICGDGTFGQLGNGTNGEAHKVVKVLNLTGVKAIAAGGFHLAALKTDGTVWTWGLNDKGQLGNGGNANSNLPTQVIGLSGVSAVAAGNGHTLALKSDGTLWAWGLNDAGQLGNSGNIDSNVPVQVGSLSDIVAIAAGYKHTLVLR